MDWKVFLNESLLSALDFLVFLFFLRCHLHFYDRFNKVVHFIVCVFICVLSISLTLVFELGIFKFLLISCLLFLYAISFFRNSFKLKIFYFLLYVIMIVFSEIVVYYFSLFYTNHHIVLISLKIGEKNLLFALSRIMLILVSEIIIKKFKFELDSKFSYRYWSIFIFISVLIMGFVFLYLDATLSQNGNIGSVDLFIATFLVIFILYGLIFYLYYKLLFYINQENQKKMLKYELDLTEKYMTQKMESEQHIKKCYHDIKNIVIYWKSISLETQNDVLLESIKEYESYIKQYKIIDVGNPSANAIISEKYTIAQKYQIQFDISGAFGDKIILNEIEISTLLGNVLDNAIEATLKIEDISKRFVKIVIKNNEKFCFIEIQNSFKDRPRIKNKKLISTKQSDLPHGIGFSSAQKIAEKYNGSMHYQFQFNIFELLIMMRCYD